jgi:ABC-type transport system involved in cytochrome bd biosynthesis fused ATPase/permease subunit
LICPQPPRKRRLTLKEEQTDVATLTESDRPGQKLFRRLGAEQRSADRRQRRNSRPTGENGAGKSTLLKALAGAQPQTRGDIWFNGETLPVDDSPVARQNKGIITIYQEFNLLPNMTVAENMFLGASRVNAI